MCVWCRLLASRLEARRAEFAPKKLAHLPMDAQERALLESLGVDPADPSGQEKHVAEAFGQMAVAFIGSEYLKPVPGLGCSTVSLARAKAKLLPLADLQETTAALAVVAEVLRTVVVSRDGVDMEAFLGVAKKGLAAAAVKRLVSAGIESGAA